MILTTGYGQDLNGKWLLKQMGTGKIKKTHDQYILDIENDKAIVYLDLDSPKNQIELKLKDGSFTLEDNKKYADLQQLNQNNLTLLVDGIVNDKKGIVEMDFVKLYPTVTDLTIEEIERFTYEIYENNKLKVKFEFNIEMMDLETLMLLGHKEGQKMKIERRDSTFFLAIYAFGRRNETLPIKEVNTDFIKLYGITNETGEITALRGE